MKTKDIAAQCAKFFYSPAPGEYRPSDNAPSYLFKFIFSTSPKPEMEILYYALQYLAYGRELSKFGNPKYLRWLAASPRGEVHINDLLTQKVPPKSMTELLEKAYFYEFQQTVTALRKFFDEYFTQG